MFHMTVPWWEFVVRAATVYVVLLVMVRLTGKRTIGQFTPFDLVVVLLLSEAVSGAINAQDKSLPGGLLAADCEIEDMRMAILEADGSINVMKQP